MWDFRVDDLKLIKRNSKFYSEIQELIQILLRISEKKLAAGGSGRNSGQEPQNGCDGHFIFIGYACH